MATLLKIVGSAFIALAVLIAVLGITTGAAGALEMFLGVAGSAFISGILIAAFGSMLTHLERISLQAAKQTEVLTELLQLAPRPNLAYAAPAPDSAGQLEKSNFRFREV
ncbi:MAG: hypothetical protein KGI75_03810 [Rhizobiaceae bacterium]|nr:hypothetical protein [Rhizobiaceae bacterium]